MRDMRDKKASQVAGTTSEEIAKEIIDSRWSLGMRDVYEIYYYKENGNNIPIMSCSTNDVSLLAYLPEEELEEIYRQFPLAKNNLYVLIDGVEFKMG